MMKAKKIDPKLEELLRVPEIPIADHRYKKRWAYLHKGKGISVKRNQYK
jgi:hypothetical protein